VRTDARLTRIVSSNRTSESGTGLLRRYSVTRRCSVQIGWDESQRSSSAAGTTPGASRVRMTPSRQATRSGRGTRRRQRFELCLFTYQVGRRRARQTNHTVRKLDPDAAPAILDLFADQQAVQIVPACLGRRPRVAVHVEAFCHEAPLAQHGPARLVGLSAPHQGVR
jgi:hypothetical protein